MFDIDNKQSEKLADWAIEQNNKVAEMQKNEDFICKPYYGAMGGAFTYEFTPTSLGLIAVVKNNITEEMIDLTDYDSW